MAWNKPGGDKQNDPWGKKKQDSPPELDELLKKIRAQFSKKLGLKSNPNGTAIGGNGLFGIGAILLLVVIVWAAFGIFIVNPAERAVILQFGKYKEMVDPGIHWIPPFIQSRYVVNEQRIDNYSYNAQMLTKDENIVSVAVAVQYRIKDAKNYLFNVVNPELSLQQATASALRQVIGQTALEPILTKGRDQVRQEVAEQLNRILDQYQTGIFISAVAMQPARAPEAVKEAFDDAIKAQEDEQRYVNQAQAYAMQVEPIAKGRVQRITQEAIAYKEQIVLKARGDIARFLALLPEYQKAPEVTRQRLYLDVMEGLLSNTTKVFVDTKGNNNLLYLPLDKLMRSMPEQLTRQGTNNQSGGSFNQPAIDPDASNNESTDGYGQPRVSYYGGRS